MKKISEFAKFLRKLRIDNDEYLGGMAEKLGVSTAYLSAVERGYSPIPDKWYGLIVEKYKLNEYMRSELSRSIMFSRTKINVDISKRLKEDKELIYKFVDRYDFLSNDDKTIINDILSKYDKINIRNII